jgi:hypothetical protein
MQEPIAKLDANKSRSDIITPQQVFSQYLIPVSTQRVWKCTNRYGWRDLTIKLGSKVVYKREAVEAWLADRTGAA